MRTTVDSSTAAPGARPLRADAQRNRARIVAAARAEFAEHGGEAQIDAIAARAEVGVGTFYRHFPTKDALVAQMVLERFQEMAQDAREAARISDPWTAFESFLRGCAQRCADDVGSQHTFTSIAPATTDRMAEETGLDACAQLLIDRGVADGSIRPGFRATEIGMLVCGLSATMGLAHPDWDWRRHLQIVLDGLRARPA